MGDVYDRDGNWVGSVNGWSGVYDASGRKVGGIDIFSNQVHDAAGRYVGSADIHGNVYGPSGELLCQVAFFGSEVEAADGTTIGVVEIAGAPEPMPDMQWRGAAALLLLCRQGEPTQQDAEELIGRYLAAPTAGGRAQLAALGPAIVRPLLGAVVERLAASGAAVRPGREREEIPEYDWQEGVLTSLLRPAHDLIAELGEAGAVELCRAMGDADRRVRKAGAVLLAVTPQPRPRVIAELRETLGKAGQHDTVVVMAATFVLALGGDLRAQGVIESHARGSGLDMSEWLARTVDSGVLELLGWEEDAVG